MAKDDEDGRSSSTVVRGLRSTVGRESTTFGFSILVTVSFGMLQVTEGSPDVGTIFLFATGAVLSFTLLEAVLSRGFRRPMPQHRSNVLALGTSLNLVSVLDGRARGPMMRDYRTHREDVQGSPHFFLADGSDVHNPGIEFHLEDEVPVVDSDDTGAMAALVRRAAGH